MPRFVILRHELPGPQRGGVHFDFMLEHDGILLTWALKEEPIVGRELHADRLANHRTVYLDYEGPVSNNRGSVSRWDSGKYELMGAKLDLNVPTEMVVRLHGQRLIGTARLWPTDVEFQRWRFIVSVCVSAEDVRCGSVEASRPENCPSGNS